jgi:hypothetical protein
MTNEAESDSLTWHVAWWPVCCISVSCGSLNVCAVGAPRYSIGGVSVCIASSEFGRKRGNVTGRGKGEDFTTRSFMICTPHQILFGWSNQGEWDRWGMWDVWGAWEVRTGFWWGDPRKGDHLEYAGVDGRVILKWIFKKWDAETWTGLLWHRIGTGDGLLWMR